MFTIDQNAKVTAYPLANPPDLGTATDYRWQFESNQDLRIIIDKEPGAWAVKLWNNLPDVQPILTPKFRNRSTAIERIWGKLCELYPDAVPSEEMPKAKVRHVPRATPKHSKSSQATARVRTNRSTDSGHPSKAETNGRHSAWATELTEALRKLFNPGEQFALKDIYRLIPAFQRRHKENHHIAARLRTTLAQDLRGQGVVKSLKRGKYRMLAS